MGFHQANNLMRKVNISRLKQFNYRSDGYYFVTIVTAHRHNIFISKEHLIKRVFYQTVEPIKGVDIDTMIVMPNHVHVIYCFSDSSLVLGEVVRRCKAKVSYILKQSVWQSNYYEHVIGNEESLDRIREYIILNPELTEIKGTTKYKSSR